MEGEVVIWKDSFLCHALSDCIRGDCVVNM